MGNKEMRIMATKSFLKEVVIKDPRIAQRFIDGICEAQPAQCEATLSRRCTELVGDEITKFFNSEAVLHTEVNHG